MPMTCTVCRHPSRVAIERALHLRSVRNIAQQYGIDYGAVHRHKHNHLNPQVLRAAERRSDLDAGRLVERLLRLAQQTDDLLEEAIRGRDRRSAGALISEVRRNVNVLARVVGAPWADQPTNVHDNRVQVALTGLTTDEIRSLVDRLASVGRDELAMAPLVDGMAYHAKNRDPQ